MSEIGRRLFAVADVFRLTRRPGTIIVAVDCSERIAPRITVGEWLEFRNPDKIITRAVVSGFEMLNPPNPDRPFGFAVRLEVPDSPITVGAEGWSL